MKHFCLSPFTWQIIIFGLLIALLWQSRPIPGSDGLVRAEYQDYETDMHMHGLYPQPGDYIDIYSRGQSCEDIVQDVLLVSCTAISRPRWVSELFNTFPWIKSVLPKRATAYGHTLVIRIKLRDWDLLEAAKRNGTEFLTSKVPARFVGTGRRRD